MSFTWKKPTYSQRQFENHWVNSIFHNHDLWCHCDDVITHFMYIINKNSNAPKPFPEIKNIKCLLTGTTPTEKETTGKEEPTGGEEPFGDGELEKLFAQDVEEEHTG